jgi:site-specific recombinase XerD
MPLSEHLSAFLEFLEIGKNQSRKTLENYNHYLKRFTNFSGEIESQDITLDLIQKFRLHLNRLADPRTKQTLSKKTQSYHLIALRAFLKYLAKNDIPSLAPEKIDLPKIPKRTVEFLTREEVERLLEVIPPTALGQRDRAIVELLFSTGLRVAELVSLNRAQVDLKHREFMVRGKGNKPRIVFVSLRAVSYVEAWLKLRTDNFVPLFLNFGRSRDKGEIGTGEKRRLTAWSIAALVRKYARLAGIIKKVTPHTLRHSFATDLLFNGADIRSVQELLGHASITTTQVYTHVTDAKLREVHEKYHR